MFANRFLVMIHKERIFYLNSLSYTGGGAVVYWMQRDQRAMDNDALLHAQEIALKYRQPLMVVFCLVAQYLGATPIQFEFMLAGLQEVEIELAKLNIPFVIRKGTPGKVLPEFLRETKAGCLITDFNPLKISMIWKNEVCSAISIPFMEVDAHNILPARKISDKQEYGAFTLRKKVEKRLTEFLVPGNALIRHPYVWEKSPEDGNIWDKTAEVFKSNSIKPITLKINSGTFSANQRLKEFVAGELNNYDPDRNFPEKNGQSGLSPYLHFGQISARQVALAVMNAHARPESKAAFLEELIVRRELSDNFCLYCNDYDHFDGFQPWAKSTLNHHRNDLREYDYPPDRFENAETHDPLWNAAQMEMVKTGKMHGYLRMYWAKKILEWTDSPETALELAIYLNDKYSLDGRDPNGYAGIAWAIGGTHDRPWSERPIFGMIRYMNYQGCKRKFDVEKYIKINLALSS